MRDHIFSSRRKILNTGMRLLGDVGSVCPAMLRDLELLDIRSVARLGQQDGKELYERFCELTASRHDICVLDSFRAAIAQARDPHLPAEQRQFPYWAQQRKQGRICG
jgi:hypothetical protein